MLTQQQMDILNRITKIIKKYNTNIDLIVTEVDVNTDVMSGDENNNVIHRYNKIFEITLVMNNRYYTPVYGINGNYWAKWYTFNDMIFNTGPKIPSTIFEELDHVVTEFMNFKVDSIEELDLKLQLMGY
jgi:hypothetical protein